MADPRPTRREFLCESGGCLAAAAFTFITGEGAGAERRYPIPAADGVSVDRAAQVVLARAQQRVFAFALSCPHEHAAVKWIVKDQRFACTKHDSKYQPDGVYKSGRATRNMDRFPIRIDGMSVVVDLDRVFESDKDRAGWDAAFASVPAAFSAAPGRNTTT